MILQLFNTNYINWFFKQTGRQPRYYPTRVDENGRKLWARNQEVV